MLSYDDIYNIYNIINYNNTFNNMINKLSEKEKTALFFYIYMLIDKDSILNKSYDDLYKL